MCKQRIFLFLSIFIVLFGEAVAQELRQLEIVGKPERLPSEIASRRDNDGNMAAAIQVVSDLDGFSYDAFNGVVGNVDSRPGMDIVYLQTTERVLEIYKTGFEPLKVILSEVGIRLQAREVWKLTITGEDIQEVQSVVIRYQPEDADLLIDGEMMSKAGTYPLTLGAHKLRIEKEGYQTIAEQIVVDEQNIFFDFKLIRQPDAGLQIETNPPGANVYLDDLSLGISPLAVFYKPGVYPIRIVKEGYVSIENQTLEVKLPNTRKSYTLEENAGYLTVNAPTGATVYLNDKVVENTKEVKLLPQLIKVRVSMPKAEPLEQQVALKRNDNITVDLFPEVKTGTIQIAVTPFDAKIELKGDAGEHYSAEGIKVFENIPIGRYTATISADGYETKTATYKLELDGRLSESIRLERVLVKLNDFKDKKTAVVAVRNPKTGRVWMDRNLGASRVATSSTDEAAYGDLYQWGRDTDGHEKRNSETTNVLSNSDEPGHGKFIIVDNNPYDWRRPQKDKLWQRVNGKNNPCPEGYRLPTEAEWEAERKSWKNSNSAGAFNSPLKLPVAGLRNSSSGTIDYVNSGGYFWSATVDGTGAYYLYVFSPTAGINKSYRAIGFSVRCIKD